MRRVSQDIVVEHGRPVVLPSVPRVLPPAITLRGQWCFPACLSQQRCLRSPAVATSRRWDRGLHVFRGEGSQLALDIRPRSFD
jgi:hypothetical protein